MTQRLDISIGPVQGFVAQSRRTRDLWGSSYLLSFLAAHAMRGAEDAGGRIVQPVVDDDQLYRWVSAVCEGDPPQGTPPRVGSLPNHFIVEVGAKPAKVADSAIRALEAAWQRACDAVWKKFVDRACPDGDGVRDIWNRQVGSFWEVTWAAGESAAGGGLLARRKHWRSHRSPDEPGDKCTVMHDLQELSGFVGSAGAGDRTRQAGFWERVREHTGPLDLRDNERLCAIALVKRLFPKVDREALGWEAESWRWPSTVHVGARPWLHRVETAIPRQARAYAEMVKRVAPSGVVTERGPASAGSNNTRTGDFPQLDANYYHREAVKNQRLCPFEGDADGAQDELDRLLKAIYESEDASGRRIGPPPSFYAILLADGDRLGRLLDKLGGRCVGQALATFTQGVPEIVREHDGETIYAGGDDVLAMLPVPGALSCAGSLSDCYKSAFSAFEEAPGATLSAAIVFAHVRLPLGAVIRDAHRLLDEVAKDGNGRNSLAVGVLKPGGLNCQWTTTWTRPLPNGNASSAVELLDDLKARLGADATQPGLSSALLYRVRETLIKLCGWESWRPGAWGVVPDSLDVLAFLRAEIGHSLAVRTNEDMEMQAGDLAALVWNMLKRARAPMDDENTETDEDNAEVGVDALLLARFLADTEHEEIVRKQRTPRFARPTRFAAKPGSEEPDR